MTPSFYLFNHMHIQTPIYAKKDQETASAKFLKVLFSWATKLEDCNFVLIAYLFARVCSNVDNFNNRNLFLTDKLLKQGC